MCSVETRRALGDGITESDGYVTIASKGEFCMKYRRRSEKLDRYLKKRVKITYKDGTEKRGILMWSTANLKDTQGIKIRVGHYYILTKTGPAEIYKCSVKHIEEDFERA